MGAPFPPDTDFGRTTEELLTVPGYRYVDPSGAQVTTGPLGGIEDIQKDPRDIDAAKALLAEAGHPNGFEVTLSARNAVGYPDEAAIVAEQLKKIGINATIKTYESAAGYKAYDPDEFQFMVQGLYNRTKIRYIHRTYWRRTWLHLLSMTVKNRGQPT